MGKHKLGIVADAGCPTGFATVTHGIAGILQDSGEYEIEIVAINYDGRPNEWSKRFKLWPARLGGDFLGVGILPEFLEQTKPDSLLLFQDFWNISLYVGAAGDREGMVAYYPVDSPNIKGQYMIPLAVLPAMICYTKFGVEESCRAAKECWAKVKEQALVNKLDVITTFGASVGAGFDPISRMAIPARSISVPAHRLYQLRNPESYNIIPHGIDMQAFKPLSRKGSRKMLSLPIDKFIIGNVNRNQSRKRLDLCIRAFAEFAKTRNDAILILHCVKTDGQGWDLEQLADYYGVSDKVIFTHSIFKDAMATVDQLNLLYNSLDIQINTGGGEGWGLTTFEGAAVRVPQVVPDWSATKEIWEGSGVLLKVQTVRHEPGMINTMQASIDTNHLVEVLSELYESPQKREEIGEKCFQVINRPEYRWEEVGKKFDKVFKETAGKKPPALPVAVTTKGIEEIKRFNSGGKIKMSSSK